MNPISSTLGLIAIGVFGILIHQAINIRSLRHQSEHLITDVNIKTYWAQEWDNMLLSLFAVITGGIIWSELVAHFTAGSNALVNWAKLFFIAVGMAGDSVIMKFYGRTQKLINTEIDSLVAVSKDTLTSNTLP